MKRGKEKEVVSITVYLSNFADSTTHGCGMGNELLSVKNLM